jgi:hypothetical protein
MKKKILITLAVIAVLGIAGIGVVWWQLNHLVRQGVETIGPRLTGVPITLADVDLALGSGKARLNGLKVGNPSGFSNPHAVTVDEIQIYLDTRSLFSSKIVIHDITIMAPSIAYELGAGGTNIGIIEAHLKKILGESTEPSKTKLVIEHLTLTDGAITVNLLGTGNLAVTMAPVELNNLGGTEGVDSAKLIGDVLLVLTNSVIKTVTQNGMINSAANGVGGVVSGAGSAVGSVLQSVGGLLGGKKPASENK